MTWNPPNQPHYGPGGQAPHAGIAYNPYSGGGSTPEQLGQQILGLTSAVLPGYETLLTENVLPSMYGFLSPQAMNIPGMTSYEQMAGGFPGTSGSGAGAAGGKGGAPGAGAGVAGSQTPTGGSPATTIYGNLMAGGDPRSTAQLQQLTGGQIGTSAAAQEALRNFQTMQAPEIQQQMALAGLGRSGAAGQAVAMGQEAATLPLIQQEIQNRMMAVPEYAALGSQARQEAMGFGGLQRDIKAQQEQAKYQDLLRRQGLAGGLLGMPVQGMETALASMYTPRPQAGGKGK